MSDNSPKVTEALLDLERAKNRVEGELLHFCIGALRRWREAMAMATVVLHWNEPALKQMERRLLKEMRREINWHINRVLRESSDGPPVQIPRRRRVSGPPVQFPRRRRSKQPRTQCPAQ